jgi:UDP-glucuronate decarboxylase
MNLGTSFEIPIGKLAEEIVRLTDSSSKISNLPLPENDPKQRRPDLSLAERAINWNPKTSVEMGLRKTIEYFRNRI